jgi:hypothetical protein
MYIHCLFQGVFGTSSIFVVFSRRRIGSRISASLAQFQVAGSRQLIARADAAGNDQKIQIQVERGAILQDGAPFR